MSPEYLSSLPLGALLDVIASDSPTPGGGSVSMISAAMGAALVAMAARISLKKGSDNPDINSLIESLDEVRTILLETAKSDITAFETFMAALRHPKGSDAEIAARKIELERAAILASRVPLQGAAAALHAVRLADAVREWVDSVVLSDVVGGRLLLIAAARAMLLNVEPNLHWIKTEVEKHEIATQHAAHAVTVEQLAT